MGHGGSIQQASNLQQQQKQQQRFEESPTAQASTSRASTSASSGASAKIKCNNCKHVQAVQVGTACFSCTGCNARVWVALSAVSEQASSRLAAQFAAAESAVQAILEEQAAICSCLWDKLQEDLMLEAALWESEELSDEAATARTVLLEAIASINGAQLANALEQVREVGLPPASPSLTQNLEAFRVEEDLETLWRCLQRALVAQDGVDLQFWCDEVRSQGLCLPDEVGHALEALRAAEQARLAELECQARLEARALEAHSRGDAAQLRDLTLEARALGVDASMPEAALASLGHAQHEAASSEHKATKPRPQPKPKAADAPDVAAQSGSPPPLHEATSPRSSERREGASAASGSEAHAQQEKAPAPEKKASSTPAGTPRERECRGSASAGNAGSYPKCAPPRPPPTPPPPTQEAPKQEQRKATRQPSVQMTREHALACLGLAGKPSPAEVRRAYKQAALKWHPDRRQNHERGEEATIRFQEVRAAFDLLEKDTRSKR